MGYPPEAGTHIILIKSLLILRGFGPNNVSRRICTVVGFYTSNSLYSNHDCYHRN